MINGKLLGNRYEIIEKIGSGGMAEVYKARCTLLNRYVAIKLLKDEYRVDEEFISRFHIESQASASLSHPNIVSIYDVGCEDGVHYIVMEYVEGITLKQYIEQNGVLSWREALDFATQICKAMEHAHQKNIVHRDIKPHNILVTENKVLKVTDFGIARTLNKEGATVDGKNAIGTVHYISPEQARGGYVDEKSDIYSMGVVLYEMLTGTLPFDGENAVSIAIMHMQQKPVPPREKNISVPAALEEVCLKAMSKEQSLRYASATEMLRALYGAAQEETLPPPPPQETPLEAGETTVISHREIEQKLEESGKKATEKMNTSKKSKAPKTAKEKKADRKAVIAAMLASLLLVSIFSAVVLSILDPGWWSKDPTDGIGVIPDLVGKDIEEAKEEFADVSRVKIIEQSERQESDIYPVGTILSQTPEAGEKAGKRTIKIKVVVSKGAGQLQTMPDFTGKAVSLAEKTLKQNNLTYQIIQEYDEDVDEGDIIRHTPAKGKKLTEDTDIILYVSRGSENKRVKVPYIIGMTEAEARSAIEQADLVWGSVTPVDSERPKGEVLEQSPDYRTEVNKDTAVDVKISSGNPPSESTDPETPSEVTPPAAQKTRYINVTLPQDRESVALEIRANGKVVYSKTHQTSQGTVDVRLIGTGTAQVEVYFDGVITSTQTIQFN